MLTNGIVSFEQPGPDHLLKIIYWLGPRYSKLTTSLVNISLEFQSFALQKLLSFFKQKHVNVFGS